MNDLRSLVGILPPGGLLVTPQAPHPGAPWGYGGGWAWYRYLGENRANPQDLRQSLDDLDEFLQGLPTLLGLRPTPLVLGGFSQGGTMSLAYALTHPGTLSAVANLSGFLVSEDTIGMGASGLRGTPVFWGHGTEDPAVPFTLAVEGRERIVEAGGNLEARDYPMAHQVSRAEASHLTAWLRATVPGWQRPSLL